MKPEILALIKDFAYLIRLYRAVSDTQERAEELTNTQIMLLEILRTRGGKMGISEIAESLPGIGESTISGHIAKLWSGGERRIPMVSKVIDPDDPRSRLIELTEEGTKAIDAIREARGNFYGDIVRDDDLTEEEWHAIGSALQKINHRLLAGLRKHTR